METSCLSLLGTHGTSQCDAHVFHALTGGGRDRHDLGLVQAFRVQQPTQIAQAVLALLLVETVNLVEDDRHDLGMGR